MIQFFEASYMRLRPTYVFLLVLVTIVLFYLSIYHHFQLEALGVATFLIFLLAYQIDRTVKILAPFLKDAGKMKEMTLESFLQQVSWWRALQFQAPGMSILINSKGEVLHQSAKRFCCESSSVELIEKLQVLHILDELKSRDEVPIHSTCVNAQKTLRVCVEGNIRRVGEDYYSLFLQEVSDKEEIKELHNKNIDIIHQEKMNSLLELSQGLAHELNNPLMFVKGFTNRLEIKLQKDHPDVYENVVEYFNDIKSGSERIQEIIDHFRLFSSSGPDAIKSFDVNIAVLKSLDLLSKKSQMKKIKVVKSLGNEDLMIQGNISQIEQVFIHLLNNAYDSLEAIEATRVVSVSTHKKKAMVCIRVEDNGPGISRDLHEKVFDPFFTTKEVGTALGLGLSFSYSIVKKHNGQITLESSPEKTSFEVQLPLNTMEG